MYDNQSFSTTNPDQGSKGGANKEDAMSKMFGGTQGLEQDGLGKAAFNSQSNRLPLQPKFMRSKTQNDGTNMEDQVASGNYFGG